MARKAATRVVSLALPAVAAMAVAVGPARAAEPVVVHERVVDVISGSADVCGTTLEYSGRAATIVHIVEQPSGGFHATFTWHTIDLTAVAEDGTVYRDISHGMGTRGATADWVADDDTGTFTYNTHESVRVFARSGGSLLLSSKMAFHVTRVDGELRVVRDRFEVSCAG
jgi:hypothetical protein